MIFHETGLSGAYLVELERRTDERGFSREAGASASLQNEDLTQIWRSVISPSIKSVELCVACTSSWLRTKRRNWCVALRGRFSMSLSTCDKPPRVLPSITAFNLIAITDWPCSFRKDLRMGSKRSLIRRKFSIRCRIFTCLASEREFAGMIRLLEFDGRCPIPS